MKSHFNFVDFDPKTRKVEFEINSKLLVTKRAEFLDPIVKENKNKLPKSFKITGPGENGLLGFSYQAEPGDVSNLIPGAYSVKLEEPVYETILQAISQLVSSIQRSVEYIPLAGYPSSDLKEEIKEAVKAKRSLCIVPEFETYQAASSLGTMLEPFVHYILEYSSPDYYNAVMMVYEEKLSEIDKQYGHLMREEDWLMSNPT